MASFLWLQHALHQRDPYVLVSVVFVISSPSHHGNVWFPTGISLLLTMEEPGEHCIVVFVSVTEPVSVEGRGFLHPLPFL
jgi:hypothetical protein